MNTFSTFKNNFLVSAGGTVSNVGLPSCLNVKICIDKNFNLSPNIDILRYYPSYSEKIQGWESLSLYLVESDSKK